MPVTPRGNASAEESEAMKRVTMLPLVAALIGAPAAGQGRDPVLDVFRAQAAVERRLLNLDLARIERVQEQLRAAADRMIGLGDDLLRAEREGEDPGELAARSTDLRSAEADVTGLMAAAQAARTTVEARRAYLNQVQVEIRRLEEGVQTQDDISGRWTVTIEPGGFRGTFDLRLDGTIITGVYQLSGGWKGSLKGTLVGGNVKLDRIDSQLGFVATYSAPLSGKGSEKRLEGTWEATNLAAGMPSSGTWVGRKEPRT
jgi:hypothetical protein